MYRFLHWVATRLAAASVAAICATGFGLLASPPAHAGPDGMAATEIDQHCLIESCG